MTIALDARTETQHRPARLSSRFVAGVCAAAFLVGTTLAVVAPSVATVSVWVVVAVALILSLGRLDDSFSVANGVLHHTNLVRTSTVDLAELSVVVGGDPDSLLRELLLVDRQGSAVGVPSSVLHRDPLLSGAVRSAMVSAKL